MTPFELNLQNDLAIERQRFANKWLFVWHNINILNLTVDVDDFRGGRIHVGGIVFQGQIQQIYWQAVTRYLAAQFHATFSKWDEATASYPTIARQSSLKGTESLLLQFVATTVNSATDTDRRLRAKGYPDSVEVYNSSGVINRARAEIMQLASSYRSLIANDSPSRKSAIQQLEVFGTKYRGTIAIVGLVAALVFGLWKIFG